MTTTTGKQVVEVRVTAGRLGKYTADVAGAAFTNGKRVIYDDVVQALRDRARQSGEPVIAHAVDAGGGESWLRVAIYGDPQVLDGPPADYLDHLSEVDEDEAPAPSFTSAEVNEELSTAHTAGPAPTPIIAAADLAPAGADPVIADTEPKTDSYNDIVTLRGTLGDPVSGKSARVTEALKALDEQSAIERRSSSDVAGDTVTPPRVQASQPARLPTVEDLIAGDTKPPAQRAQYGWRSWLFLPPGTAELKRRADIEAIQTPLTGSHTIVVANPKGNAPKTTTVRQLAATLGLHRKGSVLAWDNNRTSGNLGDRVIRPAKNVLHLLADVDRFQAGGAAFGDLADYVREQPEGFDVLASGEPAAMTAVNKDAHDSVYRVAARFYRLIVEDTGNDLVADNFLAAVDVADQLVIPVSIAEDTAKRAAQMIDTLRAHGKGGLVNQAVVVLTGVAIDGTKANQVLQERLAAHFRPHVRVVRSVPYDPALVGGRYIMQSTLSRKSIRAWEQVTADVVRGLAARAAPPEEPVRNRRVAEATVEVPA